MGELINVSISNLWKHPPSVVKIFFKKTLWFSWGRRNWQGDT